MLSNNNIMAHCEFLLTFISDLSVGNYASVAFISNFEFELLCEQYRLTFSVRHKN